MRIAFILFLLIFSMPAAAPAGDWPQILGPNRDGIAVDERIAAKWPADGLKTASGVADAARERQSNQKKRV